MQGRRLILLFSLSALILLSSCGGGLPAASWFGVAAAEGTVFLAAHEKVFALNLESGAELWAFPPQPDQKIGPFYAPPLLTNQVIIVGGFGDGKLYAISRDRGLHEWVVEIE